MHKHHKMKNNDSSIELFTQEELAQYFNIANPCICPVHKQKAVLNYKEGLFEFVPCCDTIIMSVRLQIAEKIAKLNP